MRAHKKLTLGLAAMALVATAACSDNEIMGPESSTLDGAHAQLIVIPGGLIDIVVTNVLNNLTVDIDVSNNNVAVQVCAVVQALNAGILVGAVLDCDIDQRSGRGGGPNAQVASTTQGGDVSTEQVVIGGGLVNIVITNVLNNLTVDVDVRNNDIAVQVCAAVQLLNTIIGPNQLTCEIQQ